MALPVLRHWLKATRPHTLSLTAVPVLVGVALAWNITGQVHWPAAAVALLCGLLIQVATNLYNDAADFTLGNDGADRLGPPRAVACGMLAVAQVKRVAAALFALAAAGGIYLIAVGGWPILVLGALSILSGWGYTGGPRPIAYTPLGELFVILFFGFGAVGGTCWLAGGQLPDAALVAGAAVGSFAAAVLLVNNHRDIVSDRRAGRRTLSILLGVRGSTCGYLLFMTMPFALLPVLAGLTDHGSVWLAAAALPLSLWLVWRLFNEPPGRGLNVILARTAHSQLVYGSLLCAGLIL